MWPWAGFRNKSATATVQNMFRRKFWDGETSLSPYVAALRQAIAEYCRANEIDFEDDGDYIFVHYEITISEDLEIQDVIAFVDTALGRIEKRADQLVGRRKDGSLGIFDRGSFGVDVQHALVAHQPSNSGFQCLFSSGNVRTLKAVNVLVPPIDCGVAVCLRGAPIILQPIKHGLIPSSQIVPNSSN
jgi:hypothetical protein